MEFPHIFVTVGTTDFDQLIQVIDSEDFLHLLEKKKCRRLVIQIGRGEVQPSLLREMATRVGIEVEVFRFKPSLSVDMSSADLVICHAGAGSITDALSFHKKVMVVVNDTLMENHQNELACAVVAEGYCFSTTTTKLISDLEAADYSTRTEYPPVDYEAFPKFFDQLFE